MKFYIVSFEDKRSAVKIQAIEKFNTLRVFDNSYDHISKTFFSITSGNKFFDIIQFNDSFCNLAISERLKDEFEKEEVTGCGFIPIFINGCDRVYYGLKVLSRAGPILNLDALNNYETENVEFDHLSWNGTDFFTLRDTLKIVCTERIKNICEKMKVTNLLIEDL